MLNDINQYVEGRRAEGLSEKTLDNYQRRLAKLLRYLWRRGLTRWQDVRPENLDAYVDWMLRSGMKRRSVLSHLWAMKFFLKRMAKDGRILSDPSRHLRMRLRREDDPLPEPPLSEEQVIKLLAGMPRTSAIELRNIALVELLYSAGLRLSEALALDLDDIDLSEKVVIVRKGKGDKHRTVPMLRGLRSALRDWLCLRRSLVKGPDEGALLLNLKGRRIGAEGVAKVFGVINRRRLIRRRIHPHLMRHSIAVHLLRGGADIRHVQEFLGHEDIEATKIYLRLVPSDVRKAYDANMPTFAVSV